MNGLTVKLYVVAFFAFLITDALWLGLISKSLYLQNYEPWLRLVNGQLKPLWWPAVFVYFLLALSVVFFVLPLASDSALKAALYGAILGSVVYGVYDFTCLAIFKNFPIGMGFLDWFWGISVYAWSSFLTVSLGTYLK